MSTSKKFKIALVRLARIVFAVCVANLVLSAQPTPEDNQFANAIGKLRSLGYWITEVPSDDSVYYSIIAFQRVTSVPSTGVLSSRSLQHISRARPLVPKHPGKFHVEIDLARKIMYLVTAGKVERILPIAVGSNNAYWRQGRKYIARTPRGVFKIERKIDGWRTSELGDMLYPGYLIGGIAIHGTRRLHPRSITYGCIAIPEYAAAAFSRSVPIGTKVIVF